MATVLEFSSPSGEFPLGSVFETLPGVTVELERMIPHETMIIPYFWVRGAEADDIEAAFDSHPGVSDIELIDSVDAEYLMRASWERAYFGLLDALADSDVAVLSGVGTEECWTFEVRGDSHQAISDFREACRTHDIPIEIKAVHSLLPVDSESHGLTPAQQEALVLAYERGYFDTPRRATLEEIAAELEITQQSLSSRLRRGHRRLIGGTIAQS